jgi:hypothetical protein
MIIFGEKVISIGPIVNGTGIRLGISRPNIHGSVGHQQDVQSALPTEVFHGGFLEITF